MLVASQKNPTPLDQFCKSYAILKVVNFLSSATVVVDQSIALVVAQEKGGCKENLKYENG